MKIEIKNGSSTFNNLMQNLREFGKIRKYFERVYEMKNLVWRKPSY